MSHASVHPLSQSRRALIVDDDDDIRLLMETIIGRFGFAVTVAENGQQALTLFDQADGGFDLLVTDICMPEMNGCDLVHAVRKRDQTLPIIVITGFADLTLISDIESCDAKLFEKPVNFHELRTYIDERIPHGKEQDEQVVIGPCPLRVSRS